MDRSDRTHLTPITGEIPVQVLYAAETIEKRLRELGRQISLDLVSQDVVVVALLNGSMLFLADLVRRIELPLRYELILAEFSDENEDTVRTLEYPIPFDLEGSTLLLIRDITTTGVIETYLTEQLLQKGAETVQVATLVDFREERTTDFNPDYIGFTPPRGGQLIGYGIKDQGKFGNLPFIGQLS
jgi:hypoxanthine phosphoribosyltransferase